jgi:polyphosphate kinase
MTFAEPDKAVRPMAYVVSSGVRSRLSDRLHPGIADANVARSGPTTLGPRTTDPATPRSPFDRGRSRLRFDARLLGLAEDPRQPLMERVKALAMHDQHLDEFFQVRVAGLLEQVRAGVSTEGPDGMTPGQQLEAIRERVQTLGVRQARAFANHLRPLLAAEGIRIEEWAGLTKRDQEHLRATFEAHVFPILTPLSVDPAHPFPYISDLSLNLAVVVRDPRTNIGRFARVKVPAHIPRFVPLPGDEIFVPLEQVIAGQVQMLFPGMEIVAVHHFRVTRDRDLRVEVLERDELAAIGGGVRRRHRSSRVVRLEVQDSMPRSIRDLLVDELRMAPADVYTTTCMLGVGDLHQLTELGRLDPTPRPEVGMNRSRTLSLRYAGHRPNAPTRRRARTPSGRSVRSAPRPVAGGVVDVLAKWVGIVGLHASVFVGSVKALLPGLIR